MNLKELLVVVPHSGIVIPREIPLESLSVQLPELIRNVDWYTNYLYDFREMLGNRHVVFPFCSIVLDANRHPAVLDECVPLRDVRGEPVYRAGMEPGDEVRKAIADKYLSSFNKTIEGAIESGIEFLLDGHSTVTARGVAENQIDLMNFQQSCHDESPRYYSPDSYVLSYAAELRQRLPDVRVTVNSSEYYRVYGHVCAEHSVNALGRIGTRVPAIIQETNQCLYMNMDLTPDVKAIDRLRRIFAESIHAAYRKVKGITENVCDDKPAYR